MCDYSLEHVASRPAKVGDRLTTTRFKNPYTMFSPTVGFCAVDEPDTAVCLLPGTEIAFDQEIEIPGAFWMRRRIGAKLGRFRRVQEDTPYTHHDALQLPDGRTLMLTTLCESGGGAAIASGRSGATTRNRAAQSNCHPRGPSRSLKRWRDRCDKPVAMLRL